MKDAGAVDLGRRGGMKGGTARAAALTLEERTESARNAANARWSRSTQSEDEAPVEEHEPDMQREEVPVAVPSPMIITKTTQDDERAPAALSSVRPPAVAMKTVMDGSQEADYHVLHEMLAVLPQDGRWMPRQRALWLRSFTNLLDYLITDPPCESAGHHACSHYAEVARKAIDTSGETDWCAGCSAERPYQDTKPGKFEHEKDCPLAAIAQGDL